MEDPLLAKILLGLWILVLVVCVGGPLATFFIWLLKGKPAEEKPAEKETGAENCLETTDEKFRRITRGVGAYLAVASFLTNPLGVLAYRWKSRKVALSFWIWVLILTVVSGGVMVFGSIDIDDRQYQEWHDPESSWAYGSFSTATVIFSLNFLGLLGGVIAWFAPPPQYAGRRFVFPRGNELSDDLARTLKKRGKALLAGTIVFWIFNIILLLLGLFLDFDRKYSPYSDDVNNFVMQIFTWCAVPIATVAAGVAISWSVKSFLNLDLILQFSGRCEIIVSITFFGLSAAHALFWLVFVLGSLVWPVMLCIALQLLFSLVMTIASAYIFQKLYALRAGIVTIAVELQDMA